MANLLGVPKMKNKAKRISSGEYLYRDYKILLFGYHQPDHSVVWEAVNRDGDAVIHGYTKRQVKFLIDCMLDS